MTFSCNSKNLLEALTPADVTLRRVSHRETRKGCKECNGWTLAADNPLSRSGIHEYRTELVTFDDATYDDAMQGLPVCRRAPSPTAALASLRGAVATGRKVTGADLALWSTHYDERVPVDMLRSWHVLRQQVDTRDSALAKDVMEGLANRAAPCFCSGGYDLRVPLLNEFLTALHDDVMHGQFIHLRRSLFRVRSAVQAGSPEAVRLVRSCASLVRFGLLDDVAAFDDETLACVLRLAPERTPRILLCGEGNPGVKKPIVDWAVAVLGGRKRLNKPGFVAAARPRGDHPWKRTAWAIVGYAASSGSLRLDFESLDELFRLYASMRRAGIFYPVTQLIPLPSDLASQGAASDVTATESAPDWHAHVSLQRPYSVTVCGDPNGFVGTKSVVVEDATTATDLFRACVERGAAALAGYAEQAACGRSHEGWEVAPTRFHGRAEWVK